jgi:hypothetical protein
MDFEAYKSERDRLVGIMRAASQRMRELAGSEPRPMGLTPDHIKFSPAFRAARAEYDQAHAALGRLNTGNLKRFKRQLIDERDQRRAALLHSCR